jgi:ribosome-associated protein
MTEAPAAPVIALEQFLKREGMVATGGEAKHLIQGGDVTVNGEVETRRKRKLHPGDRVGVGGQELVVDDLSA